MSKAQIILVTGTDTGVGKTYITALCLAGLKQNYPNCRIKVIKPVESGCREENELLMPMDGELLQKAGNYQQELSEIVPYRLRYPLAPAIAAKYENVTLPWSGILKSINSLAASCDVLFVEGAGGLRVPLSDGKTYVELASELDAQVLLVCANKLGVLNHASLSFECLKNNNITLLGYALNQVGAPNVTGKAEVNAEETNITALHDIAHQSGVRDLGYIEHSANLDLPHLLADHGIQSFLDAVAYNLELHPAREAACQI